MITISKILFSRTTYRDYRWIYNGNKLSKYLKDIILSDYQIFMEQKKYILEQNNHLIFRYDESCGAVFYKFCQMKFTDQMGRMVYGIYGIFLDLSLIPLLQGMFPAFVLNFILFGMNVPNLQKISDDCENEVQNEDFSIDEIWQNYNSKVYKCIVETIKQECIQEKNILTEGFFFPKLYNFNWKEMKSRSPEKSDSIRKEDGDQEKSMKYEHNLINAALSQKGLNVEKFCPKCNKDQKVKMVELDKGNGKPVVNHYSLRMLLQNIGREKELYVCQCQICNTKFVCKNRTEILDEWL